MVHQVRIILFGFVLFFSVQAQDGQLVYINDVYPEEIRLSGFRLDEERTVGIEAALLSSRWNYREFSYSYAWILNAETRKLVWQVDQADIKDKDRPLIIFQGKIDLPAGIYEVYYSTYPHYENFNFEDGFFSNLFEWMFNDNRGRFYDDDYKKLFVKISGIGTPLNEDAVREHQDKLRTKALVSAISLGDDEHVSMYLNVSQPASVRFYALGEARRDENYDFGWLINSKTRERVWELNYRNSTHAGGALKNRLVDREIEIEPGIYELLYITDDSHSMREWNSPPPFDPYFWGVIIFATSDESHSYVTRLTEAPPQETIVSFERVRDSEYLTRGFKLSKPLDLHIFVLGEGRDDEMFDFGWIIDASTRKTVWEMTYDETENAGGTSKNRLFDGIIRLEPGNYIAYYMSDDSHSYNSWNDSPPILGRKWGMTVSVADDLYTDGDIADYSEEEDTSILAKLTEIRDHDRRRARFVLENDASIHIYAIGEGSRGEMYDYAWIENAKTGRVVWEMTYHKTERAGGDNKNRLFNDTIELNAGEYYVIYESDDSHSFGDWNARPPRDAFHYGITVTRAGE